MPPISAAPIGILLKLLVCSCGGAHGIERFANQMNYALLKRKRGDPLIHLERVADKDCWGAVVAVNTTNTAPYIIILVDFLYYEILSSYCHESIVPCKTLLCDEVELYDFVT